MSEPLSTRDVTEVGRSKHAHVLLSLVVIGVLLLGVAWSFRTLWGEDLTATTPLNSSSPYVSMTADNKAIRLSNGLDQRFVIWVIARNARTWLTRPWAMFDAEICYPAPQSLALGEPAFSLGLLGTPAWLISGDPIFIYNSVVMMLPVIAGLAMFLLIRDWTDHSGAALTAAVLYAFHVVKLSNVVHPYGSDTAGTVLALMFFRRWLVNGRWRDVLALAAAVALQIGGTIYALIGAALLGALVAIYGLAKLGPRKTRASQWAVLVFLIATVLYGAFAPYIAKSMDGTLAERSVQIFLPWANVMPGGPATPGWVMLALCLAAFFPMTKRRLEESWSPRWPLLIGAVIILLLATGGNAGDRLIAELAKQDPPPALPNPYHWLGAIVPGLATIRAPLWVVTSAHMSLCVLAGLGAARWLDRVPRRGSTIASTVLVGVAFVYTLRPGFPDSHSFHLQHMLPPEHLIRFFSSLEELGDRGPILELPVDKMGIGRGTVSILMSAYHERPTSRCYNSYLSEEVQEAWTLSKKLPNPPVVEALADLGFRTLVVHHPPSRKSMLKLIEEIDRSAGEPEARLELLHRDPVTSAYRIRARERQGSS